MKRALEPLVPTQGKRRALDAVMAVAGGPARLAMRRFVQSVEVQGALPEDPCLVLMNHTNDFDPLVLSFYARRAVQFLVTEPAMGAGLGPRLLRLAGQIPKRKLDMDVKSIRTMKQWLAVGGCVGVFPEGQYPWDGRSQPFQPGINDLVAFLDVPVVTARLYNGDRLYPPWAPHPRRTRLRLELDAPRHFAPGEPVEAALTEALHIDPQAHRWPATGKRLAAGLARLLARCPSCGAGPLSEAGDDLRCACGAAWTVGGDNLLRGDPELTIGQALDRVRAHVLSAWSNGPVLDSTGAVTVWDATRADWSAVAHGALQLRGDRLAVGDWSLDLREVSAQMLDRGDLVLLRTRRQRLALHLPEDSRALWTWAIDQGRLAP